MSTKKTKGFQVPAGGEKFVHVQIDESRYNPNTGEKQERIFNKSFSVPEWKLVKHLYAKHTVLHDPEAANAKDEADLL